MHQFHIAYSITIRRLIHLKFKHYFDNYVNKMNEPYTSLSYKSEFYSLNLLQVKRKTKTYNYAFKKQNIKFSCLGKH